MPRRKKTESSLSTGAQPGSEVQIVSVEREGNQAIVQARLAIGSIVERYDPYTTPSPRYNSEFVNIYDFRELPSDFHSRLRICRHYYETDPIVGAAIDIMTEFTFKDLIHRSADQQVRHIYDAIYQTSNLREAIRWALLDYFVGGNAFPYRYRRNEKVKAPNGIEVPHYTWTVLNPAYIDVDISPVRPEPVIRMKADNELQEQLNAISGDPVLRPLLRNIPTQMLEALREGRDVVLNPDQAYHLARKRMPYQKFATPMLWRAIRSLIEKEKLIQVDMAVADGLIHQLIVFKLGNDQHIATQEEIDRFIQLLRTRSKAFTLVWNHALEVEFHRPDASWLDPRKYERVDRDILRALGIVASLISGSGSNYSQQWIAIKGLLHQLRWAREDLEIWLNREYELIQKELKLPSRPIVKFKPVDIEEERTVKQILTSLRDRGVISAETLLAETGFDPDVEAERLEEEKEYRNRGIFVPMSPYQQSPGRPAGVSNVRPEVEQVPARPKTESASLKFRMAQLDDRMREQYRSRLALHMRRLRSNVDWIVKTHDNPDKRREELLALLAVLEDDLLADATRYMQDVFDAAYHRSVGLPPHTDEQALATRAEVINWNNNYVRGFVDDIRDYLVPIILASGELFNSSIERIFNILENRVNNFVDDGLYVAYFRGVTAAVRSLGYDRGRWLVTSANPCEQCLGRHGHVFTIEELNHIYPGHNHCQCIIEFLAHTEP